MKHRFLQNEPFLSLQHALEEPHSSPLVIEELWSSTKAFLLRWIHRSTGKPIVCISKEGTESSHLYHDLLFFDPSLPLFFPAWETLPDEQVAPSPDIVGERYATLDSIRSSINNPLIITSLQGALQKLPPISAFSKLQIAKGENSPRFQTLVEQLEAMGYRKTALTSDKGEFSIRGGILDVFPISSPEPVRLDFWGDSLESMRSYDCVSQRSIQEIDCITILPVKEFELVHTSSEHASLLDYIGKPCIVVLDDLLHLEDRYTTLLSQMQVQASSLFSLSAFLNTTAIHRLVLLPNHSLEGLGGTAVVAPRERYYSTARLWDRLNFSCFDITWDVVRWRHPFIPVAHYLLPETEEHLESTLLFNRLLAVQERFNTTIVVQSAEEQNRLQPLIDVNKVSTSVEIGDLSSGFVLPQEHFLLFSYAEITHRHKIRRQKFRTTHHSHPVEENDFIAGETLVHAQHGIGKFLGVEKKNNHMGILEDYLLLEYAENAQLYVPLNHTSALSKYIGVHEEAPKLHALGGTRWKKLREITEREIVGYASELLKHYAERSLKKGFVYASDGELMRRFEEEFPYDETEDQLRAVAEIKSDMQSEKIMDRLVCGDVGYGKTEVAMRAAFKAVVDGGKQVAVLVPTTVLAIQHYENFTERMRNFPVNIGVISRFSSSKETKETLNKAADGKIDILIGTHRLISNDVQFLNLGLVVIDEEQRFGVAAKEHLKKIKTGVDCLTLSATPIPRTLYMSLIGVRDLSIINTPPQDRLPTKTIICEASDAVFRTAILRELNRDGQVFVVHNRVETIDRLESKIRALFPHIRMTTVHGQMHSDAIDHAFHLFKQGELDLLLATTIIENGIDIPNANTILIDRADQLGFANLYQIRGRVGRADKPAYAYFLVPHFDRLPELTRKRLKALAESSGYGAGMKLAMKDLEYRGAGNLLGREQSGNVAAIGFHLYCQLLKKTIRTFQGELSPNLVDTKIELLVDARLPEHYIEHLPTRMEIYRRFGNAYTWEETDEIFAELRDRFGPPPEQALWLYHMTRIRVFASKHGFTLIKQDRGSLMIEKSGTARALSRRLPCPRFPNPPEMEKRVVRILKESL